MAYTIRNSTQYATTVSVIALQVFGLCLECGIRDNQIMMLNQITILPFKWQSEYTFIASKNGDESETFSKFCVKEEGTSKLRHYHPEL